MSDNDEANVVAFAAELKTPCTAAAMRREWNTIKEMSAEDLDALNGRSKLGCALVDRYFFAERLATIGNKGISFLDFMENVDHYTSKKYVQTLLSFCEKNNRYKDSMLKRYYYIYGLCFGRINAFKVTNALAIYKRYSPTKVIDPFCGFGGRMMGALMMEGVAYRGFDLNVHLAQPYARFLSELEEIVPSEEEHVRDVDVSFCDASLLDYPDIAKTYAYDMVLTSPPYKNIEVYRCGKKETNAYWDALYRRTFAGLWDGLASGGHLVININEEVYIATLVPLLGECREKFLLTKTKKNSYDEYVYVWRK